MGDKAKGRKTAESAGVPVLPAVIGQMDDETLSEEAKKLGYPLMIKAAKGEIGRAMRMARSVHELRRALPWVKGDGLINFDDDQIYLEKVLVKPKHIEVQIMADRHGNVVHLWERDGSVQRRFQQLLEEAPCPSVTPELRLALGEASVALAKKIGYVGAGTVEFLVDSSGCHYFLEMTCRIQSGHQVTEWITGQDLVRWQISIANGEKLPLAQKEIPLWGHAVQARIYAEDPKLGFAPSSGRISYLRTPAGRNVRNDSAVYNGWNMPLAYAPILSNLSTWGPTRGDAINRMATALSEYRVGGLRNNIAFHQALMEYGPFRSGDTNTAMLDHNWWSGSGIGPDLKFVVAAALFDEMEKEETRAQQPPNRLGEAKPAQWKYWDKFNRL
jgi:acetyl-CoA carboxylase biotin carboxylase subunit